MKLQYIFGVAFISGAVLPDNGVHSYSMSRSPLVSFTSGGRWRRPSMLQLRRVVRSWQPPASSGSSTQLASGPFYDDFEDFGDFDSNESSDDGEKSKGGGESPEAESTSGDDAISASGDDAVMSSLRKRMSDLSNQKDVNDEDDEEEEEEDDEDEDDGDSGSALPDLEGNTISSIDDLIGFAQAKARSDKSIKEVGGGGGTWEDENWARPIKHLDETTGKMLDLNDLLEGGVVLIGNPAKFCSDLANADDSEKPKGNKEGKGNSFLGVFFDDPFPTAKAAFNSVSPALLAKFGLNAPPQPDMGPDRRADLLPVMVLVNRNPVVGCQAFVMNRRTGQLMGDVPPRHFEMAAGDSDDDDEEEGDESATGFTPHPLSAFMIQPLWWAGSSTVSMGNEGGLADDLGIDMIHACPYVNGSVPLEKSDGLHWGGSPVQAQKAMKDSRLEKPLSGFDFKFFVQSTRWLPSQLEQEIKDGTWYLATVSKEVLFRSRDRLGAKRAKPLWTEIIELMGDDYKYIKDKLYGEEDD